jgi:hypothetical protein
VIGIGSRWHRSYQYLKARGKGVGKNQGESGSISWPMELSYINSSLTYFNLHDLLGELLQSHFTDDKQLSEVK